MGNSFMNFVYIEIDCVISSLDVENIILKL